MTRETFQFRGVIVYINLRFLCPRQSPLFEASAWDTATAMRLGFMVAGLLELVWPPKKQYLKAQ